MENSRVLVCVTGQKMCERLIREGSRLASEQGAVLSVLHVARKGAELLGVHSEAEALEYLFKVSSDYGADMTVIRSDEVVKTITSYVDKNGVTSIILGAPRTGRKDLTLELKRIMPEIDFHIVYSD